MNPTEERKSSDIMGGDRIGILTSRMAVRHHTVAQKGHQQPAFPETDLQGAPASPRLCERKWETEVLPLLALTRRGRAPVKPSAVDNVPRKLPEISQK